MGTPEVLLVAGTCATGGGVGWIPLDMKYGKVDMPGAGVAEAEGSRDGGVGLAGNRPWALKAAIKGFSAGCGVPVCWGI